jgi:hypothetical protein
MSLPRAFHLQFVARTHVCHRGKLQSVKARAHPPTGNLPPSVVLHALARAQDVLGQLPVVPRLPVHREEAAARADPAEVHTLVLEVVPANN